HYIADYFTFPHNVNYNGSLRDNCIYEKHLKIGLREYIKSGEAQKNIEKMIRFDSLEALFQFITEAHEEYLRFKRSVQEDCRYIVNLAYQVVGAIINLFEKEIVIKKYHCVA
ncbi:hypothetical protein CG709_13885, partial [Lachnotalea glycerini]